MATSTNCFALTLREEPRYAAVFAEELLELVTDWSKKNHIWKTSAQSIIATCEEPRFPRQVRLKIDNVLLQSADYEDISSTTTRGKRNAAFQRYDAPNYNGFPDNKVIFDYCYLESEDERVKRAYLKRYIYHRVLVNIRGGPARETFCEDDECTQFFDGWYERIIRELEGRIRRYGRVDFLTWSKSLAPRFKVDYATSSDREHSFKQIQLAYESAIGDFSLQRRLAIS